MDKQIYQTSEAPAPIGPYSQAVEVGPFIYLSGQIPLDGSTGEVTQGSIQDQTLKVMKNIEAVLKSADLQFQNVIKSTIFLTNLKDFTQVNEVYGSFFKDQFPSRSCVEVSALPKGVNVEIEVIAWRGN